jgi:hypothetical protein
MNLNNLLRAQGIDPQRVLVFRHRPNEPELRKVLPWLAAEDPDIFNAYQQTQGERVERSMRAMIGTGYVASFIGLEPEKALFVGLYSIGEATPLSREQFWQVPAYVTLKAFGMRGFADERASASVLWFDLNLIDFYVNWKGRLVVAWPPPERSWWRRAHRNEFTVIALLEESALDAALPEWDEIDFTWEGLQALPKRLKFKLSEWRGVYYIFDTLAEKGYVGSACGESNLLGRWLDYAKRGDGGNKLLRQRDPGNFRFTILQRVSPDMGADEIVRLESSWKRRLHTRHPHGLNNN